MINAGDLKQLMKDYGTPMYELLMIQTKEGDILTVTNVPCADSDIQVLKSSLEECLEFAKAMNNGPAYDAFSETPYGQAFELSLGNQVTNK